MNVCNTVERAAQIHDTPIDDTITLDETGRHRRRMRLTSDNGIEFLLELESATLLMDGDLLMLSNGKKIQVKAEPEDLYQVSGHDSHHLLQLTWHVGNRHLSTQIIEDAFLIRKDPVIKSMLEELGAIVTETRRAFNPMGGAYGHGHHDHDHE